MQNNAQIVNELANRFLENGVSFVDSGFQVSGRLGDENIYVEIRWDGVVLTRDYVLADGEMRMVGASIDTKRQFCKIAEIENSTGNDYVFYYGPTRSVRSDSRSERSQEIKKICQSLMTKFNINQCNHYFLLYSEDAKRLVDYSISESDGEL